MYKLSKVEQVIVTGYEFAISMRDEEISKHQKQLVSFMAISAEISVDRRRELYDIARERVEG